MMRRQFLAGVAALGAGAFLRSGESEAQIPTAPRRIDMHHHFTAPGWRLALSAQKLLPEVRRDWTPAKSIEAMDRAGTAVAMVSTGQAGWRLGQLPDSEIFRLTRDANEYGAKMVTDYKGRFGLLANLPLPDVQVTLREIAYALDTLKADGFGITTSYGGKYIGDPGFAPVLEELNRRRAVVYTHPTEPACCGDIIPNLVPNTIEYGTDTTRMIMSLIVSGAAAKYADIRWVFSHGGGTMPFLIQRIDSQAAQNLEKPAEPNSRLYYLRRFYYDTAATSNPVAMGALKKVVGVSQIVLGTDFPYGNIGDTLKGVQTSGVFNAEELRAVERENALRLLPKYKT